MCGSLPFRRVVVVSLRPLSVCHGSWGLVTALFPSLSLFLPVPVFSWLRLLLRQGPWVCSLVLPMVVRTLAVGPWVSYASWLSLALHQALGLLVPVATRRLGFPTFAMGSPLRGRGFFCPRSKRRFSVPVWVRSNGHFMVGPYASVVPCPPPAGWGFVPRSVARLAPCSRWRSLTGWSSL